MVDNGINQLILQVVIIVIHVLVALIGGYVVAFLHRHLKDRQITAGVGIARIAVHAVEQVADANGFSSREKLADALTRARTIADSAGIHFSDDQWHTLIERAVGELHDLTATLEAPVFVQPATPPPGTPVEPVTLVTATS